MSRTAAITNRPSPVWTWDKLISTGNSVPSRRTPKELRLGPHRPSPRGSQIALTLSLVDHPKRLRHQRLDKLTNQGVTVIAEQRLRLPIDKTDHARPIHTHQRIRHGLQQTPEDPQSPAGPVEGQNLRGSPLPTLGSPAARLPRTPWPASGWSPSHTLFDSSFNHKQRQQTTDFQW